MNGARHPEKLVRPSVEHAAARHQRGIGGEPARRRGVPDMAGTRGDQPFGVGLEDLDGIDLAGAQVDLVLLHRAVADAIEARGIDAGAPQVVSQADPGCRHLRDRGERQSGKIRELEVRSRPAADDEEWIAGHDIAEADEIGGRLLVVHHHYA